MNIKVPDGFKISEIDFLPIKMVENGKVIDEGSVPVLKSHRVKNKWWKEIWWSIVERLSRVSDKLELLELWDKSGLIGRKIRRRSKVNISQEEVPIKIYPVTKEAELNMKKVHKEKGRLEKYWKDGEGDFKICKVCGNRVTLMEYLKLKVELGVSSE